jgi:hypothetical protein
LFQLRAALDDFELRGEQARAGLVHVLGRVPPGSVLSEVVRARLVVGLDAVKRRNQNHT